VRILLIEDQDILRQAIGMSIKEIFGKGNLTALGSYTAFELSNVNAGDYDVALLDPGAPPVTNGNQIARLKAIADVSSKLSPNCLVAVMTGDYNQAEAETMLKMGVKKYMSKVGLSILELRDALNNSDVANFLPNITGNKPEHFNSKLNRSEMLGHAVDQGIYDLGRLSDALEVDVDTVRKYIARARSRMRVT
jgi:DNA-binding NarL/FixJ family response regulator